MMTKEKRFSFENVVFSTCVLISFVMMCCLMYGCFFNSIMSDETFTLYIINDGYIDIVVNTVQDVHPPMFYFILKFFVDVFMILFPMANKIVLAKLISFSSVVILFYFLVFVASKKFPKVVVGLSLLLIFCLGSLNEFSITFRMYGFSMLFIVLCFYYAVDYVKTNNQKDVKWLILYFELAALSHYFALMAVAGILVFLICYSLIFERKRFWDMFKCEFYSVLFYVPWLVVLCCQFAYLSAYGYWIPEVSVGKVVTIFEYVFTPKLFGGVNQTISAFVLMGVYLLVALVNMLNKKIDKYQKFVALLGIFVMFFVIGVGLFVSILITPIFVERYTIPSLFVLYFSVVYNFYLLFSTLFADVFEKIARKLKANKDLIKKCLEVSVCLMIVVGFSVYGFFNISKAIKHEKFLNENYNYMMNYFASIKDDADIVLSDDGALQHPIEYQTNQFIYGLKGKSVSWWENITGVNHPLLTFDDVKEQLLQGKNVYFVERQFDLSELEKYGLEAVLDGSFEIEQQWLTTYHVDVYKIKLA